MQPRSRIRGRDPPPPPSGGRYRRRSPPPPSPRHHRRARDPPPSQPQRRSPERPRRQEEKPPPDVIGGGAAERRSRADILLEAGRLAAHYLVAQGVLPEHLLRAREEPKHSPSSRPEPPAAAGYVRKRDDTYRDDDPRWRRNNGGAADWGRDKEDVDRLSRRSGWDRRSQSFDGRRKYNDGGGGDIDRGDRRSHEYDEQRRASMRRSYSHNDRRASSDGRGDRRRRSRSRSRTRTRSHYYSSRRDSDWRAGGGGLDHSKVPEPGTVRGGDGDVDYGDIDQVPRDLKAPRSVVVMEANDGTGHEDAEMESEVIGLDHGQDVCGDEDGDNAVAGFNDADIGEINVTQDLLSNVDAVHPSDPVEEPVHMQSQLSDVEEGDMEAGIARRDACLMEPVAENNGFPVVRDEMEAPHSEVETDVGDLTRDEQELPAWYGIFDFNVVRTQESCEMSDISGDPPADHVCDSVPDLVGRMGQRANYHTSETQGQGEHAHDDDHQLEDGQVLLNQGIGTHELNKYDLNNEQRLLNQRADENAQDNRPLKNEQMHLNHGVAVHDLDNCHLNDEEILLKQDADEQEDHNRQMENEQMLLNQSTAVQVLDNYHMNGEHLLLNHGADEHPDNNRRMENEQVLLHHVTGVHDLDNYDLNSEQILQNNGTDKPAAGSGQLKDEQMLLDQAADGQATLHCLGIRRMIPVINLEDDYEEQSDTREFLESKSDTLHKHMDNVLPEHMCSQDQQTSSFPDHPQANIPAAASSSVTPNFVNRWTGRGAVNAQGIPSDDDVLYVAFDKMPLEVINVWDLPSSELGKSL